MVLPFVSAPNFVSVTPSMGIVSNSKKGQSGGSGGEGLGDFWDSIGNVIEENT